VYDAYTFAQDHDTPAVNPIAQIALYGCHLSRLTPAGCESLTYRRMCCSISQQQQQQQVKKQTSSRLLQAVIALQQQLKQQQR
jgi:hypothetical protein